MVVLLFDSCFKNMDCITDYIGQNQVGKLMQQYDDLIMIPLLKIVMGFLNPSQITSLDPPTLEQPFDLFDFLWIVQISTFNSKGY